MELLQEEKLKCTDIPPFNNAKYVELPIDFNGGVVAGDFFLCGDERI